MFTTPSVQRSISRKFMLAVLATTCTALLVASAAILYLDVQNFRTAWVNDLTTQSEILARVSIPAVEFNDPKVAQENLEQLKARPGIYGAAIYGKNGALFAKYTAEKADAVTIPPTPGPEGYTIKGGQITVFKSLSKNGENVGTVYLQAFYPLAERVKRYSFILLAVMAGSLIIAGLVSYWLQAAVTKPVLALTSAVHQVVRKRDFSMRVKKSTNDEVGVLVDAFNDMLTEVGNRSEALEKSSLEIQREMKERIVAQDALRDLNSTLEQRIALRTSELERAHEQLRQSQKLEAIGQLTGGVAHDFNNVLQVIAGNLQLLQMSVAGNPEAQRRLETAAFAADRGAKLSSQLLSFARRQPLQPLPTNLGRVLRTMDDLLRRALGESIYIETVVSGGLWNTLVDPNQLENVVLNLAINARDAMKNGGRLTLELGNAMLDEHYVSAEPDLPAGQYVQLSVSDTGGGMTPEVLQRAFEPFFTTKRDGEGTGLGLSMVYGFVKQSHGHIRIYSEVGSGTTVRIYLPRSLQDEIQISESLSTPPVGGVETILVVEDDLAVQATVVDMLAGLGYRVLKANDGESALNVLRSGIQIDLLFTDVVMPGSVRSPDLAREAKALFPDIAVLFTSGYTQNAIVHGGRLDPGVELLSKPYRRDDLARKIRSQLGKRPAAETANSAASGSAAAATVKPDAPLRILVVEDNQDAQVMTCELLMMLGHLPSGVASAEAAIEALAAGDYEVLLTDVSLPGMSGVALARSVLQRTPGMKIIFASGFGRITSDDFEFESTSLPKPYALQDLRKALASVSRKTDPALD
ncbi:MAG: response regulator [Herminiimonas sp.]|nr:response regulator [Herminiimonas sp.]